MAQRRRPTPFTRWGTAGTAACCRTLTLLLLAGGAAAQIANWNTTAGNWGNANNWDCTTATASSHCIPGPGFQAVITDGDVTLDVDATVARILGSTGTFTMSGKTLTATDVLGIQLTNVGFTASGGSVINGFLLVNDLTLQDSTINGSAEAFAAHITNGTLGPLTVSNDLNASNSSIGSGSVLTIGSVSSISNSTIGGQFAINFGASLIADNGSIINSTQTLITSGSLTIQGGSTWTATTQPVFLGLAGSSELDVSDAGSVLNLTNTALELGEIASSAVTVENQGRIAATGSGGNFLIGLGAVFSTDSSMTVNSGGTAEANNITVSGSMIGSTGVLSVSDASSSVTADGQLLVATGGAVNAANQSNLTVNSLRIQDGSVTIDSSATLDITSNSAVLVGSGGAGTLTLQGGATASASGELVLGTSLGSAGALTITDFGSQWNGTANVSVGEGGAGSLTVSGGGVLVTGPDANGVTGSIGTQSTGTGGVTVQGGDWQANGALQIGAAGTGTLQLLQAGTVESGPAVIGASAGSNGMVLVSGVGSQWTIAGNLTVGSSGTGSLTISGAGLVMNVNAVLGDKAGSSGTVTVSGLGSAWQNSGILTVGGDGAANLTIDAGTVTAGGASMGSNLKPVQVDVTNQGALSVLGDVTIGGADTTAVTIEKGGTFDSGENATIGGAGGDTTVTVTGAGSAWTLHGTGNLTIDDKGSLLVMDGGTVTSTAITVDTGGLLNGQGGNIIGSVFNNGGTITPGDATGVMSITGNYTQTSGSLLFEIDGLGPAQFDRLVISGLATITGGTIDLLFGNGFVPAAGESFDLLFAALGLTLGNVSFDVTGLPPDVQFTETIGANGFELSFSPAIASAPEPGSTALFILGVLAMLVRRRKSGKPVLPMTLSALKWVPW